MPDEFAALRADLSLDVADRRAETYTPPPVVRPLFHGTGHTLGSVSASTSGVTQPTAPSLPATAPVVDDSLPTTQLQIRLIDGTKLVAKFNTSNTLQHVRAYIDSKTAGPARRYLLSTAFPPQVLTDELQSLAVLGLQNAVVVQKGM
eukprot:TRINITY_DN2221_c0_g1_i4.p3 TRINITY_DN2221_c0_g1~~TRINITY_DN2221_c0_g1_i4.p3  ORF type:complete len:147 (-),score=38.10 TRINITY_DN2221_c0_g1_i4:591-1031(-)